MSFSTDQADNFHQVFDVVANHCESLETFGLIYRRFYLNRSTAINREMLLKLLTRNKKLTALYLYGLTIQACQAILEHGKKLKKITCTVDDNTFYSLE